MERCPRSRIGPRSVVTATNGPLRTASCGELLPCKGLSYACISALSLFCCLSFTARVQGKWYRPCPAGEAAITWVFFQIMQMTSWLPSLPVNKSAWAALSRESAACTRPPPHPSPACLQNRGTEQGAERQQAALAEFHSLVMEQSTF